MNENTNNNDGNSNINNQVNDRHNKITNNNKKRKRDISEMEENSKIRKELEDLKSTINKQKKRIKQLENKNKVIKELEFAVTDLYSILENYNSYYSEGEDSDWIPTKEDMEELTMEELQKFEKELQKNLSKMTELEKKQAEEYRNNRPKRNRKNTKNIDKNSKTKQPKKTTFERNGDYIEYDEEMANVTEVEITENEMRKLKKASKSKEDFMNKIMDKAKEKAHPDIFVKKYVKVKK